MWSSVLSVRLSIHNHLFLKVLHCPLSSVGKEPPCNAGDPSLIPGWGRSTGEGIGYPLQYSGLENSMGFV